jgi:hypothetical protein
MHGCQPYPNQFETGPWYDPSICFPLVLMRCPFFFHVLYFFLLNHGVLVLAIARRVRPSLIKLPNHLGPTVYDENIIYVNGCLSIRGAQVVSIGTTNRMTIEIMKNP